MDVKRGEHIRNWMSRYFLLFKDGALLECPPVINTVPDSRANPDSLATPDIKNTMDIITVMDKEAEAEMVGAVVNQDKEDRVVKEGSPVGQVNLAMATNLKAVTMDIITVMVAEVEMVGVLVNQDKEDRVDKAVRADKEDSQGNPASLDNNEIVKCECIKIPSPLDQCTPNTSTHTKENIGMNH
ncbi:hypothetical protein QR680_003901 [Steinernema hermaphroditum]|uniref:Uncharacterized protein n=1 Tax=Steinernema hermaphroditum TaxID=289476 RepID=A0AA39LT35_9BILA|nr:hypothetical protein QR680_003901 [Steinernema hermaphroditum]